MHRPGIFIPADRISSAGMHRHGIFHPCRQNLLSRDASPRHFSSLQTESPRQGCIATAFFIPADRISSAGMHRHGIFHLCRQNLLSRDASPRHFSSLQTKFPRQGCIATGFSSLQTEFPRQGCIAPGFFILADRISSAGMHRPGIFHPCRQNSLVRMHRHGIFHPCRQNLLGRDASPRHFSSLQTESPRQGYIAPAFFIPVMK